MKKMTEEGIEHLENHEVSCFWFDGRKNDTKVILVNEDDEEFPGVRKETHYTIVEEPGGEYLTHLTPEGGKGQDIANAILTWLEESSQLEGLKILDADGTAVNMGPRNGALHLIEEGLERKAQWNICKLHINELGLRHLIADIDGLTNSENTFF